MGDFILTLPALKALRDAYPHCEIEILGYSHIAAIADKRFYADAVRSIEYGALSRFFARDAELPPDLRDYVGGFDLILSYLYDPDRIFEANLRRCGAQNILCGPAKIFPGSHATEQLAKPLQQLGLNVIDFSAKIFSSSEDRELARQFLRHFESPVLALHPGSGSEKKNWPLENWIEFITTILSAGSLSASYGFQTDHKERWLQSPSGSDPAILIVSGEADENAMHQLRRLFEGEARVHFAHGLPLPRLAAILQHSTFIGHDSGISHLAAAAGASSLVLFGPTDPKIWAPRNESARVLIAPNRDLKQLAIATVLNAFAQRYA